MAKARRSQPSGLQNESATLERYLYGRESVGQQMHDGDTAITEYAGDRVFYKSWLDGTKPPLEDRRVSLLDEVRAYTNRQVITRFLQIYPIEREEAKALFDDIKMFLWACAQTDTSLAPTTIIDKMWHNFILFTPAYAQFCNRYFGYFIHHHPADKELRAVRKANDPAAFRAEFIANFRRQCEILYDLLGEETVTRWYVVHPRRYGSSFYQGRNVPEIQLPAPSEALAAHVASHG